MRADVPKPNGNTLDREGRLVTCQHASHSVTRTELDGSITTLVDRYEGERLNSPNDVVVRSDGTIWFTDPSYGLGDRESELDGDYVFRLDPESGAMAIAADGFERPNGLCFSPDERTLYVADSGCSRHVRAFDVAQDGTLSGGRVVHGLGDVAPDGMRCDAAGRLYVGADDGVHVLEADGRPITVLFVPEGVRNLCFGGADGRTLFLTAGRSLYSIRVVTSGV